MEVPISKFRREIFELVNRAAEGEDIALTHRGRRFRVIPDPPPGQRLDRLTPLPVVNPNAPALEDKDWQQEMIRAWENDWADL